MKKFFYINDESYEQIKIFQNQIFRIEEITGMTITEFEIIYFYSYEEATENLEEHLATDMRILVPNRKLLYNDTQYKNILFKTYQDNYEHYRLEISYEYLSREKIEEMKSYC